MAFLVWLVVDFGVGGGGLLGVFCLGLIVFVGWWVVGLCVKFGMRFVLLVWFLMICGWNCVVCALEW